jgi:outer membrane protein, heavy metal efflux system
MNIRSASVLLLGGAAALANAAPLTFEAALNLADQYSAENVAQTAGIAAAQAAAAAAGRLPDPRLTVGLENLPATGPDRWHVDRDFMTMRKVGLMQDVPSAALRRASAAAAAAAINEAKAQSRIQVVAVRTAAALAWLECYYVERRVALYEELRRENELFAAAVQAQLAGGRAALADNVAPGQEAADLADRHDALEAAATKSRARLRRLLGPAGDAALQGEPPAFDISAERLRAHVHAHPELAAYGPMIEAAQAEIHKAEAARVPDWNVELSYGRRASGYSDMVSLQFSVALPIFAGTRQNPLIEASRKSLQRLEAERIDMLRDHTQRLEGELADYSLLSRQLSRLRDTRLPLARRKVDLQMASYQANKADLAAVLSARRDWIETRLTEIDLAGQLAAAAARIQIGYEETAP